jgi:hypothetical protein
MQSAWAGEPRGIPRSDRDIDRGQLVLIQAEGFSRQALDQVSRDRVAATLGCDRESQARMSFVVGEYGHGKVSIGKTPASLSHYAKLGRLVQSLARLER